MREIKFRAWDKVYKKIYEVEKLYFENNKLAHVGINCEELEDTLQVINIGLVELMQYTGIKDRSDKEIYEGDIVHLESMLISNDEPIDGVVVFNEGAWWIENKEEKRAVALWGEWNYLRVKGNIYENPEFLKED